MTQLTWAVGWLAVGFLCLLATWLDTRTGRE